MLLLRRRDVAIREAYRRSQSLSRIARSMEGAFAEAIVEARAFSRAAGSARLRAEAAALGIDLSYLDGALAAEATTDVARAKAAAKSYAERWLRKAQELADADPDLPIATIADDASLETLGSVTRTAVTENAESFNDGRRRRVRKAKARSSLLRMWDAQLDKRTCRVCSDADGTIVGARERFPDGEPGAVHPWCRCTWHLLTVSEAKRLFEAA